MSSMRGRVRRLMAAGLSWADDSQLHGLVSLIPVHAHSGQLRRSWGVPDRSASVHSPPSGCSTASRRCSSVPVRTTRPAEEPRTSTSASRSRFGSVVGMPANTDAAVGESAGWIWWTAASRHSWAVVGWRVIIPTPLGIVCLRSVEAGEYGEIPYSGDGLDKQSVSSAGAAVFAGVESQCGDHGGVVAETSQPGLVQVPDVGQRRQIRPGTEDMVEAVASAVAAMPGVVVGRGVKVAKCVVEAA